MSLQQTALQQTPEAGEEWVLDGQTIDPNAPNQDDPNAEALDPNAEPVVQQPAEPSELEKIALELGWTPQDKWRGDPTKWTPAADYIRTTGRVLERTKHEAKRYRGAVETLEQRLARLEKGHQSFEQQQAQQLFEQYEDAKFDAAQKGDTELYRKLTDEQQKQMARFKPADQPQQPQADVYAQAEAIMNDPIAARFLEANPIVLQDVSDAAWNLMDREMSRVHQAGGGAAAQFRAAEEALRYAYPHLYETPSNGSSAQPHHSQTQPRTPAGQFAQQHQPAQQRRPAPVIANASRVTPNTTERSAVDRLDAEAKAFLQARIASGEVKDAERWARIHLGEKPNIIEAY